MVGARAAAATLRGRKAALPPLPLPPLLPPVPPSPGWQEPTPTPTPPRPFSQVEFNIHERTGKLGSLHWAINAVATHLAALLGREEDRAFLNELFMVLSTPETVQGNVPRVFTANRDLIARVGLLDAFTPPPPPGGRLGPQPPPGGRRGLLPGEGRGMEGLAAFGIGPADVEFGLDWFHKVVKIPRARRRPDAHHPFDTAVVFRQVAPGNGTLVHVAAENRDIYARDTVIVTLLPDGDRRVRLARMILKTSRAHEIGRWLWIGSTNPIVMVARHDALAIVAGRVPAPAAYVYRQALVDLGILEGGFLCHTYSVTVDPVTGAELPVIFLRVAIMPGENGLFKDGKMKKRLTGRARVTKEGLSLTLLPA